MGLYRGNAGVVVGGREWGQTLFDVFGFQGDYCTLITHHKLHMSEFQDFLL